MLFPFLRWKVVQPMPGGGLLSRKGPTGMCRLHGWRNQPLGILMTPYEMQNLVYEWVDISKFGQIWAKIGSNLRKFWKKFVILFKIWPKIRPIGIWMGYLFLKNWYLYGSTFKFRGGTTLPKPNLSTPPGGPMPYRPLRFRRPGKRVYIHHMTLQRENIHSPLLKTLQ